jgi:hypothetical protein
MRVPSQQMNDSNAYKARSRLIDEYSGEVVEITGIPAIGKTYFLSSIQDSEEYVEIFDAGRFIKLKSKQSVLGRLFTEGRNIFYLLYKCNNIKLRFSDAKWLFFSSFSVRGSLALKANIFINCLLKFSYHNVINYSNISYTICIVDEGISHIPFLLQDQLNPSKMVDEFYYRFKKQLSCLNVVCIDSDSNTIDRLLLRGHKRVKLGSKHEAEKFDDMNRSTLKNIVKYSDFYKKFTIILIESC